MKKGKHLGIRIDEELHYKMQYIAAYEDRSLNGEVLYALRQQRPLSKNTRPHPLSPQAGRLAPRKESPLPRHGLKSESVLSNSQGKNKTGLPTSSKWQIGLFCGTSPIEGVAVAAGGAKRPPQGSTQRGYPSGRFFGDFLIGGESHPGAGRSACWWGRSQV